MALNPGRDGECSGLSAKMFCRSAGLCYLSAQDCLVLTFLRGGAGPIWPEVHAVFSRPECESTACPWGTCACKVSLEERGLWEEERPQLWKSGRGSQCWLYLCRLLCPDPNVGQSAHIRFQLVDGQEIRAATTQRRWEQSLKM